MKQITYDEWFEFYKPKCDAQGKPKDMDPRLSGNDIKEWEKAVAEYRVWTWIETPDDLTIVSGVHWVNALEYYICRKPCREDIEAYEEFEKNPLYDATIKCWTCDEEWQEELEELYDDGYICPNCNTETGEIIKSILIENHE